MSFWVIGMIVIPYECIRLNNSGGLSKDYLFLNLVGFFLMAFQDVWGFFGSASYSSEVHISDIVLSFSGVNFGATGLIIVHLIKSYTINTYTLFSIFPNTVSIVVWIFVVSKFGIDEGAVCAGTLKAILSLASYVPQWILVYKNKTTLGWSMTGVWVDALGGVLAVCQVIVDYYNVGKGTGFWNELNWGKFLLNVVSFLCCCVFFFQHYYLYRMDETSKDVELSLSKLVIQENGYIDICLPENFTTSGKGDNILDVTIAPIDMRMQKSYFGYVPNRKDADAVLKTLSKASSGIQSLSGLSQLNSQGGKISIGKSSYGMNKYRK